MLQVLCDLLFVAKVCIAGRFDSQFAQAGQTTSISEIHMPLDDKIIEEGISF